MGLDRANIFKLNNEDFEKYKKDPFLDGFESTKTFAKALMHDIETKETPHSLLLSADYGMGKTFFATRFTQYLRKNRYDVIYFSVWENDYIQNPFIAFSKEIISYIHNKFKTEKYKSNVEKVFSSTEKLIESITFSTGVGIDVSAEKLIHVFKAEKDPIIEFRKQLKSFINKIPKKKLIIIVDELDRCRPDYAMKTLECIKHFFDIEGLFVILPTNKEALNDCITSLYGIDNRNRVCKENYFQKFFNDERILKKPNDSDYIAIVNQFLTNDKLNDALAKKLLVDEDGHYNSISILRNFFAIYSFNLCLTVRELKDLSYELARICNNFYEPIRSQWLACVFSHKNIVKDSSFKYPLHPDHCFYEEPYKGIENSKNGKHTLLCLHEYINAFNQLKQPTQYLTFKDNYSNSKIYSDFIISYKKVPSYVKNYSSAKEYLNKVLQKINNIESINNMPQLVIDNMNVLKQAIEKQKCIIEQYQNKYGSDDEDLQRKNNYENIIKYPEMLYSVFA